MTGVDVASLVGTWVAAGVAIIALVGIIGPILVWRASRDVRHKALMVIGSNNNGYMSNGVAVWPGIRFFQKVRAPKLKRARAFTDTEWRSFDCRRVKTWPESPATWVQFGACLQAYNLKLDTSGDVTIRNGKATIAISRDYLTLFLLLGRYGDMPRKRGVLQQPVQKRSRRPLERIRSYGQRAEGIKLYGVTGTMTFALGTHASLDTIEFIEGLDTFATTIPAEKLFVRSILLLLHGYLPLPSGHHVSFLDAEEEAEDHDSSDDGAGERAAEVSWKPTDTQLRGRGRRGPKARLLAYQLAETTGAVEGLELLPKTGLTSSSTIVAVPLDRNLKSELETFMSMTYVPAASQWVRISQHIDTRGNANATYYGYPEDEAVSGMFIRRHSVQLLALALLSMAWHPEGYVVSGVNSNEKSKIMEILCGLAERMPRMLYRLKSDAQALHLDSANTATFLAAADGALQNIENTTKLLALDEVLESIQLTAPEVQHMVGILTLTNEEFRTLVYQSARYVDASSQTQTEFDLGAGILRVPSAFGVVQVFEVDISTFKHIPTMTINHNTVTISHSQILLAALRAYVRSAMLANCIASQPIVEVLSYDEDVYMMS